MLTGFTDEKIVSLLGVKSPWSKRACREILLRKNDFILLLLGVLDEAIKNPHSFTEPEKDKHIPAALLLAQMREQAAYPRLVSLMGYEDDMVDQLWGDFLFETYPAMLRDTFNGDSFRLPEIIENRSVSPWSRGTAARAWGMHYFDGHISREEITGYFRHLIHEVYTGEPDRDVVVVLTTIADCIREQQLTELMEDVKSVYARKGIDLGWWGNYENYVKEFSTPGHNADDVHVDDTIQELEQWGWFNKTESSEQSPGHNGEDEYFDDNDPDEESGKKYKIGRNDPCPCGSGKKYKNCCIGIL